MKAESDTELEQYVREAQGGSKAALEVVISYAQGYIYNLSLRMLQRPADAEDATQEILITLITHLGQFRGESAFSTWMYRLATNVLLNIQRGADRRHISFEEIARRMEISLAHQDVTPEEALADTQLTEEVRRSCTLGMLLALDRQDRMALILGELVQVDSAEGVYIMDTTPAAYRQRLSRARRTLIAFVSRQCGIVNPTNPCRCYKHIGNKITSGELDPAAPQYAAQPHDPLSAVQAERAAQPDLDKLQRGLALFRAHPVYASRNDFQTMIDQLFAAGDPDA